MRRSLYLVAALLLGSASYTKVALGADPGDLCDIIDALNDPYQPGDCLGLGKYQNRDGMQVLREFCYQMSIKKQKTVRPFWFWNPPLNKYVSNDAIVTGNYSRVCNEGGKLLFNMDGLRPHFFAEEPTWNTCTNREIHLSVSNPDFFDCSEFYKGGEPMTPEEFNQYFSQRYPDACDSYHSRLKGPSPIPAAYEPPVDSMSPNGPPVDSVPPEATVTLKVSGSGCRRSVVKSYILRAGRSTGGALYNAGMLQAQCQRVKQLGQGMDTACNPGDCFKSAGSAYEPVAKFHASVGGTTGKFCAQLAECAFGWIPTPRPGYIDPTLKFSWRKGWNSNGTWLCYPEQYGPKK